MRRRRSGISPQFLSNHPDISDALKRHVEILESLKRRYRDIRDTLKGGSYEQS